MKEEVRAALKGACDSWLSRQEASLDREELVIAVEPPPANVPGDLASNLPLAVAKKVQRPPREVAQEILKHLSPDDRVVERAEVAGPGFLNFTVRSDWLLGELRAILKEREAYAACVPSVREKILLEFVSANPNGPLHVGHGRGAALGDSLARILRQLGHEVQTEYYVNDVGNQMRNLGASLMWRCRELSPGFLDAAETAEVAGWPAADLYKGEYLIPVAREVVARFAGKDRPRGVDFFRRLGLEAMLELIRQDLGAFNVRIDSWFSESRLYEEGAVDKALDTLRRGGHLKDEEGALWFLSTNFGDDKDRVIKRKDERPTYFASDIAYHGQKFDRGFQRLIDIWGTDHHGYVRRVKAAVQALGRDPDKLAILLYQLVSLVREGKPVAMSTRSGEFVTLREVVEEVGVDACRFFFAMRTLPVIAMRSPDSHLEFDLDLAKKQAPENPVFYVQYVHARCYSIFKKAAEKGIRLNKYVVPRLDGAGEVPAVYDFPGPAKLHPAERALLIRLASYPDVLQLCGRDLSPHHLTAYLLALSGDFHRFYENCQVLGEAPETEAFRLALVDGVRTLIDNGLSLLGVRAPKDM